MLKKDPKPPKYLVYIDWFTDFAALPHPFTGLYIVRHSLLENQRRASVISLDHIHRSVHLIPKFGPRAPQQWDTDNVLEQCDTFYVNSFSDRHVYHTII